MNKATILMLSDIEYSGLHNHTHYSNIKGMRDSINRVDVLIDEAYKKGYKAIAITDHSSVSGHVEAVDYYNKKYKDKDFKVILGEEIYLVDDIQDIRNNGGRYYHMVLLAKNKRGHKAIRKISSQSWKNFYLTGKLERTPIEKKQLEEIMKEHKGDVIASSACLGSELSQLVLKFVNNPTKENKVNIHRFIKWCQNVFGEEDFYFELQPNDDEEQVMYNRTAIKIAKAYGIKWIITNDAHYLTKEDGKIHSAFINANSDSGANERDSFYKTTYIMTPQEMWDYCKLSMTFDDFKEAMRNTIEISNKCEVYELTAPVKIPQRKLPIFEVKHLFKDYYKDYKYINLFATSEEKQDLFFLYLVENGFIQREQEINDINLKRIDDEMEVLWEVSIKLNVRMSAYYNMMELLIKLSWEEGDSIIGVSRGSGTGFYTGYLLGLSQINPITHNLPYWRHLSVNRPELGDWDFDSENTKRKKILEAYKNHFNNEYDNVLNIGTFKTEGTKSTVQTCCRGMGINRDEATAISSLVKSERGKQWSIREMLYGDEEKERKPIYEFKNAIARYEGLEEALFKVEGLIVGKSVHASGIFIYENGYIEENNSMMKTASGVEVTSFDMNDSTNVGNLKYDALTVEALDKIRVCMDLLVRDGYMEWQGTLKKTYDKYLHPDILDYETEEMWDILGEGTILDVFQFQTDIGIQTIKQTKPKNLEQLAHANSLMRLTCDGDETPTETFVRYKNNINEWYQDMDKAGLSKRDMEVLEPHLLSLSGIASTQEDIMEMSMNPIISGFTEVEANKLRKGISKKIESQIKESKELFFKKGLEIGNSEEFLNYVWNEQFGKQLGYAFSRNHTVPYSVIAIQEMNLAYHYPMIYWLTAVLICNSGSADEEEDGSTDYGKIATAIGNVQRQGVNVALPNINKSGYSFEPDVENNRIYYGLFAISGINQEIAHYIINNRPYNSLDDFMDKTKDILKNTHYLALIKAGAFDELEGINRKDIMKKYISKTTNKVTQIDGRHIVKMLNNKLTPYYNTLQAKFLKFRNYIFSSKFEITTEYTTKSRKFYLLNNISEDFFKEHFIQHCEEGRQYYYDIEGLVVNKNTFDTVFKKVAKDISEWSKSQEALDMYNQMVVEEEFISKFTSIEQGEIESLNYYYTGHIMDNCNIENHGIEDFFELSETPIIKEVRTSKKGFKYNVYNSYRIAGTVIHKDKNKHLVYLSTPTGVVPVKYRDGVFSHYDKRISVILPNGKKKVYSESWFKRHTHLVIEGYRKLNTFIPYVDDKSRHTTMRVVKINKDNEYPFVLEVERPRVN